MNPNIFLGQKLKTTTNEFVTIVAITEKYIYVRYKGKTYRREIDIIGKKLFVIEDNIKIDKKKRNDNNQSKNIIASKNTRKINTMINRNNTANNEMDKNIAIKNEKNKNITATNNTCKNCMEMRKGDCFGSQSICEYYRYAPSFSKEETDSWPKYGDATYFRMKGRKK